MRTRHRVYAYITHGRRLLVFAHTDVPEAGIQVPAGTVRPGEPPYRAVMREAEEETGLIDLELVSFLGRLQQDMTRFGVEEDQHAWFYHLRCGGRPPESWRHGETSGGRHEPIRFDLFWAALPDGVPELIALNGAMLPTLIREMGLLG